jgi:hypothetical protein
MGAIDRGMHFKWECMHVGLRAVDYHDLRWRRLTLIGLAIFL